MANKKIRFGETVRIKDEKFNPPLYVEARIFEQRRDIFTKSNKKVKLGDFIEYTEEELRAVIDRLSKQIQAKISQSELIEYTYSKVEIDDKDEYIFDEGKAFAEAVGVEAEDNAKQYAEQQDEQLKIDVEDYADQVAEDKSAEALSEALAQSVAQDAYDTKMAQIADDLSEKAGIEYVDGQLQVIDDVIDDLSTEIDTKADGSTVYTISEVDNMINNTVSLTQYTTDMDGIISDLSSQSTQIGQNTEAIGLQAGRIDMVEGTVSDHSAQFLTMADEISAKVSADYVQTAIDDVEIGGRNLIVDSTRRRNRVLVSNDPNGNSSRAGNFISDYIDVRNLSEITGSISNDIQPQRVLFIDEDGNGFGYSLTWDLIHTWKVPTEAIYVLYTATESGGNRYKLEKGNKATDWTPAPEDVEAEISSLSAGLSVQAGRIDAKADSSTVTALGTRVSTAETNINALEGEISSKVSLSEFNALDGTVSDLSSTVSQQATQISARVTDSKARSIFTQEAGSFTFQANQINFDRHVFGSDATFTGDISGANITGSTVTSYNSATNDVVTVENGMVESYRDGDLTLSIGQGSLSFYNNRNDMVGRFLPTQLVDNPSVQGLTLNIEQQRFSIATYRDGEDLPVFSSDTENNFTSISGPDTGALIGSALRLYANRRLVSSDDAHSYDQPSILMDQSPNTNNMTQYFGGYNRRSGATWSVRYRNSQTTSQNRIVAHDSGVRLWREVEVLGDLRVNEILRYNRNSTPDFSGSANLRLSTGATASEARIGLIGSRRELKRDIEPLDITVKELSTLNPVRYKDKNEYKVKGEESPYYLGFIAEEVAESDIPELVDFNDERKPMSVNYDRFAIALLNPLLNHEDRITEIETEI